MKMSKLKPRSPGLYLAYAVIVMIRHPRIPSGHVYYVYYVLWRWILILLYAVAVRGHILILTEPGVSCLYIPDPRSFSLDSIGILAIKHFESWLWWSSTKQLLASCKLQVAKLQINKPKPKQQTALALTILISSRLN